jgi:hypothetical protein
MSSHSLHFMCCIVLVMCLLQTFIVLPSPRH